MSIPNDTSPDVERMQLELLRAMSPQRRLGIAIRLSDELIRASKRAIRREHPELSDREVEYLFIELHYGRELAEDVRRYDQEGGHGG